MKREVASKNVTIEPPARTRATATLFCRQYRLLETHAISLFVYISLYIMTARIAPELRNSVRLKVYLWPPCIADADIIFLSCGFYLSSSSSFSFSSPNLSGRRLDVYHTSTHGVALVRIYNAGLKCAACDSLGMQDPKNCQKFAIWAPSHHFVLLYLRN